MDFRDALAVLRALEADGVEYALVGSMAMAAQGLVRATQDIDFFISPSPENVTRVKRALSSVFRDPCIDEISAVDLAGEYPAVRYVIRMKRGTVRPLDHADAAALRRRFCIEDE